MIGVGDLLRDNDPRGPRRTVRVLEVTEAHAIVLGARRTRVALARIFEDSQTRTTGFSLIKRANTQA